MSKSSRDAANEVVQNAVRKVTADVERRLSAVRCPEHGKAVTNVQVKFIAATESLQVTAKGCCEKGQALADKVLAG